MKIKILFCLLVLFSFAFGRDGDILVDFKGTDLIIEHEDYDDEIIIDADYQIYINDDKITLDSKCELLSKSCYERVDKIKKTADKIEDDGISLGVKGGALGVSAVAGVFKMLLPGYDSDDFERDIEDEAEKIEREAEKIEKRAHLLEKEIKKFKNEFLELSEINKDLNSLEWLK